MIRLPVHSVSAGGTTSLLGLTPEALSRALSEWGEPRYRAGQVLEWVYRRRALSFEPMTNLPVLLRERLSATFHVCESTVVRQAEARDGTIKRLLRWADGATTECVMIPDGDRRTACLSTQVGCPVGCVFCASGLDGLERQLSAGQIVEQALHVAAVCGSARLTNIVLMGMGEPLHNYEATLAAIRTLNAEWGLHVAARKITLSTVGLPKQMKRLAEEQLQINLAISLHAPNDALRRQIIPWAESISLDSVLEAAGEYFSRTGREVTLEYILLAGVNDQPVHARELASVVKRLRCNVNLIRYNPIEALPYQRPTSEAAERFQELLRDRGINSHLRRSRGLDVDGACGQLRKRYADGGATAGRKEPITQAEVGVRLGETA